MNHPALSIRQPWAWLIVNGFKDIENRDWATPFRGRFLVHAGQTMTRPQYDAVVTQLLLEGLHPPGMPLFDEMKALCGGFVGWSRVTDCVREHPSKWKQPGSYGFVLADSRPIPFVPWKGRLGWFNVPIKSCASV